MLHMLNDNTIHPHIDMLLCAIHYGTNDEMSKQLVVSGNKNVFTKIYLKKIAEFVFCFDVF